MAEKEVPTVSYLGFGCQSSENRIDGPLSVNGRKVVAVPDLVEATCDS